ncbi:MSMEG_0567/Sll0786 family nitrogen starvation N-acetyltransferase [Pseudonocardia sp. T1-2H]|uniref:MSMEG_0567/Sll0786 family nitrogen starvation N-acetyltransferase n=1 Tax=Pseudonocardia sp. T1-2H TaxID=3128899 RepID=UPI0031012F7B
MELTAETRTPDPGLPRPGVPRWRGAAESLFPALVCDPEGYTDAVRVIGELTAALRSSAAGRTALALAVAEPAEFLAAHGIEGSRSVPAALLVGVACEIRERELPPEPVERTTAPDGCRIVPDGPGRAAHHAVRSRVFVQEQAVFDGSDVDPRDTAADTLHVLCTVGGDQAGCVRLYPLDGPGDRPGDWQGDRLAVLAEHRTGHVGAELVRFAVATAGARGGSRMIAYVQPVNERFFRRLGWSVVQESVSYVGRPHVLMDIPLTAGA